MYIHSRTIPLYYVYTWNEVLTVDLIPIKKWGNSNGLRLPKYIVDYLDLHTDDKVKLTQEEVNGKKRLILEPVLLEKGLTIEELFVDYNGERHHVDIQHLGEATGHEKW